MTNKTPNTDAAAGARALVAATEQTLNDLVRSTGGLTPLERAEAERIRQACRRLLQCARELAGSELVVAGSMKRARPHPLLKFATDP
jgi:methylphosphotriester-DNA--protein-cysteine methyltransferase